jgi:hypothetical protein
LGVRLSVSCQTVKGKKKTESYFEFHGLNVMAANVPVLPKAGYSVFRQPILKLIYFLLPKITFVAQ